MSGGLYATQDMPPLPLRWRVIRTIATLVAAAVLMFVIADWAWRWFAPVANAPADIAQATQSPSSAINAAHWFGSASPHPENAALRNTTVSGTGLQDARLLGIIGGHNGAGYAVLRLADRGPVIVATDQEIVPGVTLQAITPSGIRVSDRGEVRDIPLRPSARESSTPIKTATDSPLPRNVTGRANAAACPPPGGSGAPVYRLNAELLTGIAAKPDTWSNAFTGGSEGLSMREGNAFGSMLGMKPGDRVTQANGVALHGAEDVLVAVIRPLLASQPVRVSGVRDGRPAEWVFVNASACPA